jgi:hypothetical protein
MGSALAASAAPFPYSPWAYCVALGTRTAKNAIDFAIEAIDGGGMK